MFGIEVTPSWTDRDQEIIDRTMTEPGFDPREYREAHRSSVPIAEFSEYYDKQGEPILVCPVCGSEDVESDSHEMYGAVDGYTKCGFCGYSTSWADLSAII